MNYTPTEEDTESPIKNDFTSSTPEKPETLEPEKAETANENPEAVEKNETPEIVTESVPESHNNDAKENAFIKAESPKQPQKSKLSPKLESKNFLQSERSQKSPQKSPKFGRKLITALSKTFSRHKSDCIEALGMLLRI